MDRSSAVAIPLSTSIRKLCFAALLLGLASIVCLWSARAYLGYKFGSSDRVEELREAVRLQPSNPGHHALLGNLLFYQVNDRVAGLEQLQTAARLNPYSSRSWLDLTSAYRELGNPEQQRFSIERAISANPKSPDVIWEGANDYLLIPDTERAFPLFRELLDNNTGRTKAVLDLCWRTTGSVPFMLNNVISRRGDLYGRFLQLLIDNAEPAAAAQVWSSLLQLNVPPPQERAFSYVQYLIDRQDAHAAAEVWQQTLNRSPELRGYAASDNLIVNGRLAKKILNRGFDWRYQPRPDVTITLEPGPNTAERALSIVFDGGIVGETGLSQFLALQPDNRYEFRAKIRTENLDAATGPQFAIQDAYRANTYLLTEALLGTNPWREVSAEFTTPDDASLGVLKIVHVPGNTHLRGTMWITDVRLTKLSRPIP